MDKSAHIDWESADSKAVDIVIPVAAEQSDTRKQVQGQLEQARQDYVAAQETTNYVSLDRYMNRLIGKFIGPMISSGR